MANQDKPFGLKPVSFISGVPWNGECNVYYCPSSDSAAIFKRALVTLTGSADDTGKYPTVKQYEPGDPQCVGIAIGFSTVAPQIAADPSNLNLKYRIASTSTYIYVVDAPDIVCEVQEDSDGGAIAAASVGLNCELVVGSGNTTTGLSAMELDSSSVATTATLPVQLLRLADREDNEIGNQAKWLVRLNTHSYHHSTGL